jgi:nucleoside-diphosphate-sugar epimerase
MHETSSYDLLARVSMTSWGLFCVLASSCGFPQMWYAVAKTLAEKEAWQFASDNQLDLIVVLPSFVVGPSLPADNSKTVNDVLHLLKGKS